MSSRKLTGKSLSMRENSSKSLLESHSLLKTHQLLQINILDIPMQEFFERSRDDRAVIKISQSFQDPNRLSINSGNIAWKQSHQHLLHNTLHPLRNSNQTEFLQRTDNNFFNQKRCRAFSEQENVARSLNVIRQRLKKLVHSVMKINKQI